MPRGNKRYKLSVKKGMKRYALRKKKIPGYSFTTDITRIKCECYGTLYVNSGTQEVRWSDSLQDYLQFHTALADSQSFMTNVPIYQRYKIYGISLRLTPASSPNHLSSGFSSGLCPGICAVVYPNYSGTSLGNIILANDRKMLYDSLSTQPATKYWGFPDNFYDTGGMGLGIWSRCLSYASQTGELCVCQTGSTSASGTVYVAKYLVTFYVMFSDKNG